ncbi:MAG: S8/S53 family peptidase [Candidatus Kapabacteria bacterium]|nr:S8/S53 family peptidase [Candidatus Kapabacteria bacterium]
MKTFKFIVSIIALMLFLASCSSYTDNNKSKEQDQVEISRKFDLRLKRTIARHNQQVIENTFNSSPKPMLNLMISGETEIIRNHVVNVGGKVNSMFSNMLTAHLPIEEVYDLAKLESVRKMELGGEFELHNDSALVLVRADLVHKGYTPLEKKYTGKGVVVGIIDTGIDIFHDEFRLPNDSTKSRIAYLWSQLVQNGKKPTGFEYGVELSRTEIESDLAGQTELFVDTLFDTKGHGTHVAATAAGNNGLATESDIIMVQIDFNNENQFLSASILDAVKYIYDKAEDMGMPCVINTSFGQRIGIPHDGADSFSKAIDELIASKSGRALVASAGNDGDKKIHLGEFQLEQDSLWIYSWRNNMYFYIPKEFANQIEFKIEVDSVKFPNTMKSGVKTQWKTISSFIEQSNLNTDTLFYEYSPTDTACFISYGGSEFSDTHDEFEIILQEPRKIFNLYKIMFRGSGTFHSWNYSYIANPSTTNGGLPSNNRYVYPDNKYCISSPAVAHNTIAVGSYVNRIQYKDINGNLQPIFPYQTVGKLSTFSSAGPSTDLRIKPDIVAPGETIISARSARKKQNDSTKLVGDGTYIMFSGTSMSTPVVSGAAALFFEKYPDANAFQLRDAIMNTAIKDEQSLSEGELPNAFWGSGKLDVFGLLSKSTSSAENDNPYNSANNISISPNPASDFIEIDCKDNNKNAEILNLQGEIVLSINLESHSNNRIDVSSLSSGMYFVKIGKQVQRFIKL